MLLRVLRDRIAAIFEQRAREDVAGLGNDELLDVFLRQHGVAGDLDLGDLVLLALGDAGGDEHVALVGTDRHLGGVDAEVHVAAVQVPGVELLQVAGHLLLRVLVVAAIPGSPVVLLGFPAGEDVLVVVLLGADQVDVADLGGLAFLDRDGHVDAVAVERAHRRGDLDVVLAAVVVLARQFLGHAVQAQAIEGAALGQADVGQALEQFLGLDVLVAGHGELVDRRTFLDRDHQDVALAVQLHVLEEAGAVQGADRIASLGVIDSVAAVHRQIGEYGARGDALQPVDADVAGDERFRRQGEGRHAEAGGKGKCKQAASGKSRHVTSG